MPQFAANLTLLFTEVPMLDRPDWAARCGFDGVEVLFPYDHSPAEWERALAGLPVALINTPPGDWLAGDRGFAARPGDEATFRDGFLRDRRLRNGLCGGGRYFRLDQLGQNEGFGNNGRCQRDGGVRNGLKRRCRIDRLAVYGRG